MNLKIRPGQIWRHFKGGYYRVFELAKHSETGEELVIYAVEESRGETIWARPVSMWLENVDCDGKSQPRFTLIFDPYDDIGWREEREDADS